jgi:hypothetical protein
MTSSNYTSRLTPDVTETSSYQGMSRRHSDDQSSYSTQSSTVPPGSGLIVYTRQGGTTPSIPTISFIGNAPFHLFGIMNVKVQQPLSDWYPNDNRDVNKNATTVLRRVFDIVEHCSTEDSRNEFHEVDYRARTDSNVIKTYGFSGIPGSGWHLLQPRTRSWNNFLKSCVEDRLLLPSDAIVDGIVIDFSFPESVFKFKEDWILTRQTANGMTCNETYPIGTQILEIVPPNGSHKWGKITDRIKSIKADGSSTYTYITDPKFGKGDSMKHAEISQLVVNAVNNKEAGSIKKSKERAASVPAGDTATTSPHGTSPQARMNIDSLRSDDDNIHRPQDSPADPTVSSGQRIELQFRRQRDELTHQPHPSLQNWCSPITRRVTESSSRTMQSRNNTTPTVLAPDDSQAYTTASSGHRIAQPILMQQQQLLQQPHPTQILEVYIYPPVKQGVTEPPSLTTQRQLNRHNSTTPNVFASGQQFASSAKTAMSGFTGSQTSNGGSIEREDLPESTALGSPPVSSATTATSGFTGSQTGNGGSIVREDLPESTSLGNPTASSATTAMSGFTGGTRKSTDVLQSDDDQTYRPADLPAYTTVSSGHRIKQLILMQQQQLMQQPHSTQLQNLFSPLQPMGTEPPPPTTQRQLIQHINTSPIVTASGQRLASLATTATSGGGGSTLREDHTKSAAFGNRKAVAQSTVPERKKEHSKARKRRQNHKKKGFQMEEREN